MHTAKKGFILSALILAGCTTASFAQGRDPIDDYVGMYQSPQIGGYQVCFAKKASGNPDVWYTLEEYVGDGTDAFRASFAAGKFANDFITALGAKVQMEKKGRKAQALKIEKQYLAENSCFLSREQKEKLIRLWIEFPAIMSRSKIKARERGASTSAMLFGCNIEADGKGWYMVGLKKDADFACYVPPLKQRRSDWWEFTSEGD